MMRHLARDAALGDQLGAAKRENSLPFHEEFALLGKEQAKAGEIQLLRVGFHLREVGVVRHVEHQVLRQPVFQIAADIADRPRAKPLRTACRRQVRDDIGLQLEVLRATGRCCSLRRQNPEVVAMKRRRL